MLWTTLKRRVANHVHNTPAGTFNQILANAQGEGKTVEAYLDDCDIRLVASLREHARPAFPRHLRSGMLWATHNAKGEWKVGKEP